MLAGILAPSGGVVQVLGQDLYRHPRQRRHISYLAEQAPLYPELTISEQLDFSGRLYELSGKLLRSRIDTVLKECQLEDEQDKLISQLSKGFRQRVGLAQSLLHEAEVIILDEPTDGLDPLQIRSFRGLIERLSNSHAILISSHQLSEIATLCNRVMIMKQGRNIFSGTLEEVNETGASLEQLFTQLIYAQQEEPAT
jgi:ABC-2 type transport system ATP-binding protein